MSTTNKKEWQKEHFETNKNQTKSEFVYMTKAVGMKVFYDPKKW